ncbi:MAG: UDP-N-acetyl-D-mannosaminuronic acid dehydrogenase [Thermoproteota archaeon]|nr:UDP-N-acetyl-D-mannosaminuronic acid dehydrogenase [Thermoproteota archaeon]
MVDEHGCVSVYGLGYVGLTLCAAWLRASHRVLGVDILEEKVKSLNEGSVNHSDVDVEREIVKASNSGRFKATLDGVQASRQSDVKLIAIPVGLTDNCRPILKNLEEALKNLAQGLKGGDVVILESSVPPGTTQNLVKSLLEKVSGLKVEDDFYLAYSPERIDVGRALEDIEERYPKIVGGIGPKSSEVAGKLYRGIAKKGVTIVSSPTVAELEKLAEGVYRDVNIALANELAVLFSDMGVDYDEVAVVANSQPFCHLHKPGVGVGGACIPVYPQFLMEAAKNKGDSLDLTSLSRRINSLMPDHTAHLAMQTASKLGLKNPNVTILGLAFRGGIDDTRLSPTYDLVNTLVKSGIEEITVNDPYVAKDKFLEELGFKLTKDLDEALKDADIAIIATDHPEYEGLSLQDFKNKTNKERIGIVDGRHMIKKWRNPPKGVAYVGIGRPFQIGL